MTGAEAIADLKIKMGSATYRLTDPDIYAHINAAKRHFEDNTNMSFKGACGILTAAGDKTFNLSLAATIQLTTSAVALSVEKVWPDRYKELTKVDIATIKQKRATSDYSGIPKLYAVQVISDVLWLDIYPAALEAGTLVAPWLLANITERYPNISATQDSLWPSYANDGILYRAAVNILTAFGETKRYPLINKMAALESLKIMEMSNERSSGKVEAGKGN